MNQSMALSLLSILRCVECRSGSLKQVFGENLQCLLCGAQYRSANGKPVLIRKDNELFPPSSYQVETEAMASARRNRLSALIPSPSLNLSRSRVLERLKAELSRIDAPSILVVGSGTQKRDLEVFGTSGMKVRIVCTDIDRAADVDFFCDAHELPFGSDMFDLVITTAVLEHVVAADRVVGEIHRVLKSSGILYSELPFMQQVHEGAYDFTRYTLSGHRRLLNNFEEMDSGMVAGPATCLVWALENFAISFLRHRLARSIVKALVRLIFSWLKYLDRLLVSRPEAMDGASCTYFMGRKSERPVSDANIIARYVGAKHITHV